MAAGRGDCYAGSGESLTGPEERPGNQAGAGELKRREIALCRNATISAQVDKGMQPGGTGHAGEISPVEGRTKGYSRPGAAAEISPAKRSRDYKKNPRLMRTGTF